MKKAQSSIEFLLLVAFTLLMLVPATLLFLNYSADSQASVLNSQMFRAGTEIALTSELMYGVGEGSWQTIDLVMPASLNAVTVYEGRNATDPSEIVLNYGDPESTVVIFSKVPLRNQTSLVSCSSGCMLPLHEGTNRVRVENIDLGDSYPVIRLSVVS